MEAAFFYDAYTVCTLQLLQVDIVSHLFLHTCTHLPYKLYWQHTCTPAYPQRQAISQLGGSSSV